MYDIHFFPQILSLKAMCTYYTQELNITFFLAMYIAFFRTVWLKVQTNYV